MPSDQALSCPICSILRGETHILRRWIVIRRNEQKGVIRCDRCGVEFLSRDDVVEFLKRVPMKAKRPRDTEGWVHWDPKPAQDRRPATTPNTAYWRHGKKTEPAR